ncbi:MAG: type II TA system antitoxin MqsA family protein [Comamonas sp.]
MSTHTSITCPFCASSAVAVEEHEQTITIGRKKFNTPGFLRTNCEECGEVFITAEQFNHNASIYACAGKSKQFFVTPGIIRKIREKLGLTQRQASKLFGAGDSSVAKWEAGLEPSGPAALLLQCTANVPGVGEYLASLADVEIEVACEELKWKTFPGHLYLRTEQPSHRQLRSKENFEAWRNESFSTEDLYGVAA